MNEKMDTFLKQQEQANLAYVEYLIENEIISIKSLGDLWWKHYYKNHFTEKKDVKHECTCRIYVYSV